MPLGFVGTCTHVHTPTQTHTYTQTHNLVFVCLAWFCWFFLKSQAWLYTPAIPTPEWRRQSDQEFEFEITLDYMRPSLKNKQKKEKLHA